MRTTWGAGALVLAGLVLLAGPAEAKKCKKDAVQVGNLCVDKYEASVWETTDAATIKKIQKGKIASAADLGTATQRGATTDDYGTGCPDNAAGCKDFYAVSVSGVTPAAFITQIQATAACRNAGKRLLTNGEWTAAALGTPDPGTDNGTSDCNVGNTFVVANTGSRSLCASDSGAFDMVGNLWEWVADWVPRSTACPGWGGFSDDYMCLAGASTTGGPGAPFRGGYFMVGTSAGVFAVSGLDYPSSSDFGIGFRCAREP